MLEFLGVPTVTFCTHPFRTLASVRRQTLGLPELPIVYLPHPMMTRSAEQIEQLAGEVVAQVVAQLTESAS